MEGLKRWLRSDQPVQTVDKVIRPTQRDPLFSLRPPKLCSGRIQSPEWLRALGARICPACFVYLAIKCRTESQKQENVAVPFGKVIV